MLAISVQLGFFKVPFDLRLYLSFGFIFLLLITLIIFIYDSLRLKITPNPTSAKVRKEISKLIPRNIEGKIYELGSGFGDMALFFSLKYPNCTIISYEKALIPFLIQTVRIWLNGSKNITLIKKSFLDEPLKEAGLVFCYLYPKIMSQLEQKFSLELNRCLVITHTFSLQNMFSNYIIQANDLYLTPIYRYEF